MGDSTRFRPAIGLSIEPLGDGWVAFSPLSGETMFLNDQCAAIIEVLSEASSDRRAVCGVLSDDAQVSVEQVADVIGQSWAQLVEGGLIVALP